jgi:hypothetical protein
MAVDECEPPTILAQNKNKAAKFDYYLKGHDDVAFTYEQLVYEPAHCIPASYQATLDTGNSVINAGTSNVNTIFSAAFDWSVMG